MLFIFTSYSQFVFPSKCCYFSQLCSRIVGALIGKVGNCIYLSQSTFLIKDVILTKNAFSRWDSYFTESSHHNIYWTDIRCIHLSLIRHKQTKLNLIWRTNTGYIQKPLGTVCLYCLLFSFLILNNDTAWTRMFYCLCS